ncbi:UDP-glucuronosyltransferase 2B1 [Scaptodrosophila lebanonensis]|uniref:UDP-glucuronosyltransferase n=1 Tax=Drosophila lebanonensis TaxID=7225 RepID=A0A6J2UGL6_DROLE|nr:UDP-glucuronosyltransferase 2B1 [Scaptodrosophila lebanonensis]
MQQSMVIRWCLLFLVAFQSMEVNQAARILAPFFFPGKSHLIMTNAIVRELVKRGHEVTFITAFSLAKENLGPNYKEVLIPQYDFWPRIKEKSKKTTVLEMADLSSLTFIALCQDMGLHSTDFAFQQPEVQALIQAKNKLGKYDLLLAEEFYNEGALILGHLYQIPIVTISTFGYTNYLSNMFGFVAPWSFVTHMYLPYTDRLSFSERIHNTYLCTMEVFLRRFYYLPAQDAILRKHFSHLLDEVPTVKQLNNNVSAILINNFMPLDAPRPTSFNMIPVGGLHIVPPKPLPKHLQDFLDGATHGAIYFSLGSQVRSAEFPPEKIQILLEVFGSLKQRVLWKFEADKLDHLPDNVMIQNWLPQADILAHPNVKVFIAHGGQFGIQEAVYYGVPLLGIPIYADQHGNIHKSVAKGYALGLSYDAISTDTLNGSLSELLYNPKYQTNAKRASRIYRDRPLGAMDTAMYWIDYVIEHRGAPHIISASLSLSWYQLYLLDVLAVALVIILIPLLGLYFLCTKSSRRTPTKVKRN